VTLPRRRQGLLIKSLSQWAPIDPPAFADWHFPRPTACTLPTTSMARVRSCGWVPFLLASPVTWYTH